MKKRRLVFFTGAGISAESGISTFRDNNGLWENNKIEEICNISTWKKNRKIVFDFYNKRRSQLKEVLPNKIHFFISDIQKKYSKELDIFIITQNIDDLLEKANTKKVLHVHGNLKQMHCTACNNKWDIGYEEVNEETIRCPKCNSNKGVKPNVVFFGEIAPKYREMKKILNSLDNEDMLIVMGTMGNVVSINNYANYLNSYKILNNLEESPYINEKYFNKVFYRKGSEAIKDIENEIKNYFKLK